MTAQDPRTTERWAHLFPSTSKSVPRVRGRIRALLEERGHRPEDIDVVELVCSELATNAVRHGRRPGRLFEVALTVTGGDCLVEVSDADPRMPRPRPAGVEDEGGRGLVLVMALAKETGHQRRHPIGKTVWARLELGAPS